MHEQVLGIATEVQCIMYVQVAMYARYVRASNCLLVVVWKSYAIYIHGHVHNSVEKPPPKQSHHGIKLRASMKLQTNPLSRFGKEPKKIKQF
jgi:hypothetical protein